MLFITDLQHGRTKEGQISSKHFVARFSAPFGASVGEAKLKWNGLERLHPKQCSHAQDLLVFSIKLLVGWEQVFQQMVSATSYNDNPKKKEVLSITQGVHSAGDLSSSVFIWLTRGQL